MNERIKELLQNKPVSIGTIGNWGRVEWANNVYPQIGDQLYADVDLQKFAEAIVRECMNAVCDPRTTYLESMTDSSAMYAAREKIRKHFGGLKNETHD
jgi:hypothetical protein